MTTVLAVKKTGSKVLSDFPLYQITVPISLRYSTADLMVVPKDVEKLIPKLCGSRDLFVQKMDTPPFNHIDFVWGMHAALKGLNENFRFFCKTSTKLNTTE